jgi:DNA-binding MarR family transcriptional regulator
MNIPETKERDIVLLENIYREGKHVNQRDLARIAGLSLGMTNAILKRLIQKGWLKVRKVNSRKLQYIVSSQGIEEIAKKSYLYFRRTIKNVVYYKETIANLINVISKRGFNIVLLVGKSDLDFIIEHFCMKNSISLEQRTQLNDEEVSEEKYFIIFSEENQRSEKANEAFLHKILIDNG